MTTHIETCATILSQAMRITDQGKWQVFVSYMAETNSLVVYVRDCAGVYMPNMHVWLGEPWFDAGAQLAAIRTELDKLEGGE
jgi:hypothetical protein